VVHRYASFSWRDLAREHDRCWEEGDDLESLLFALWMSDYIDVKMAETKFPVRPNDFGSGIGMFSSR
jgi:hypothetical protein